MVQAEAVEEKTVMMPSNRQNSKRISTLEKEIEELEAEANFQEQKESEEKLETDQSEETKEEETKEETPKLTKEEETFKKRYGDLRRHSQKKEQELTKRIEELEASLNKEPKAPVSEKELEEWIEKYPDAANMVQAVAQRIADEKIKSVSKDFDSVREEQMALRREKAIAKIEKKHPDFQDLQADDKFHDWVDTKPTWVKNALYENEDDADSVIEVLNLYKYDTGAPARKKEKEKEAASSVETKGKSKPSEDAGKFLFRESEVADPNFDYEKYEEAIEEAIRTGKFEFDITGPAR